jgi:hypothetical protein
VIWDWGLQLLPMNEEFPVSAIHHIALITSLPFVHTARRYYRLEVLVRHLDLLSYERGNSFWIGGEVCRTQISRGSKSRNKVSVGEPAEGSLQVVIYFTTKQILNTTLLGSRLGSEPGFGKPIYASAKQNQRV